MLFFGRVMGVCKLLYPKISPGNLFSFCNKKCYGTIFRSTRAWDDWKKIQLLGWPIVNTEVQWTIATHCDLSVEITHTEQDLKSWPEMWFKLLKKSPVVNQTFFCRHWIQTSTSHSATKSICQWWFFSLRQYASRWSKILFSEKRNIEQWAVRKGCSQPVTQVTKLRDDVEIVSFREDKKYKRRLLSTLTYPFSRNVWKKTKKMAFWELGAFNLLVT